MALDKKNLFELAKTVAKAKPSAQTAFSYNGENFSYSQLDDTLRDELNSLVGTPTLYRQNKNVLFELIEETISDILPKRVLEAYGEFAEIRSFPDGDRPIFVQSITAASRRRAKSFVTKVGLAGVYEVFRLDGQSYEVQTSAFGGAASIQFEEYLTGRVNFAEVTQIILEGLDEAIYLEIERALVESVDSLLPTNKKTQNTFVEADMDSLLSIADSYGGRSTIYCTFEFAATMLPQNSFVSDAMKDQIWANGYLGNYKAHRVIVLPQSYEVGNAKKVIDPSYAFIMPAGDGSKPIKIAFEGALHTKEVENEDWSKEIRFYHKVGVAAIVSDAMCVYRNSSLAR